MVSDSSPEPERGGGEDSRQPRSCTYTDLFNAVFPNYLAIGMTEDAYWNGDPWLVRDYLKAHRIKREIAETDAWIHGLYVRDAIASVFGGKKKKNKYPDKPYGICGSSESGEAKAPKQTEQEKSDMAFNAYMTAWMSAVNKKFENQWKEVDENGKQKQSD